MIDPKTKQSLLSLKFIISVYEKQVQETKDRFRSMISTLDAPSLDDLEGWKELYNEIDSTIAISTLSKIIHSNQYYCNEVLDQMNAENKSIARILSENNENREFN